ASEFALPGTAPTEALHTFTLDSGASCCFFRDSTTPTPLLAPVLVRLADPSGGPVLACSTIVLPCPAVPFGSLSGLHLPSFSTNLVSTAALQDAMVTTTTTGGQRVAICTCTRKCGHLATFTRRPGSTLYTLTTEPAQVAASGQVSTSGPVATPYSCRLLLHHTLLWHRRVGQPSLPRLRGMHSRLLVSGLPRSLPPLPPSPAPPCLPCVEGWQRAASHSSSFHPTTSPLLTLHMDVWGSARVSGQDRERYFLLVVDDYTRYTTVFPLRSKGEVPDVLIPWIRAVRLQLREQFRQDLLVLRLHSDRGGEFSSNLLWDFFRGEGILESFTLPASPQQNGVAERRIGLVMEVARSSMIHAAAPHFLWPFAVRYAANQLNLWPRVSLPETSPTLRWTGKVDNASVLQVWGSRAFVRDTSADKLASRAFPCIFLGISPDAPGWQFYHPTSRRVLASQGVMFDESVPFYRVSQVDPLPLAEPIEVIVDSGATGGGVARGAASGGADPAGAEPGGAELASAEPGGAGGPAAGGTGAGGAGAGGAGAGGTGAGGAGAGGADAWSLLCPSPHQSQPQLQPNSSLPAPSPYAEQIDSLTERRERESRRASPVPVVRTVPLPSPPASSLADGPDHESGLVRAASLAVISLLATIVTDPSFESAAASALVALPPPPASSLLAIPDLECDLARAASPAVSRLLTTAITDPSFESTTASALVAELVDFAAACRLDYAEEFECLSAVVRHLVAMLRAPERDPNAPDIPTLRSYAEAIMGPCSSQWQTAMDAEMSTWKSTGTYVDAVPPPGVNIVDGMWIFGVMWPSGSPSVFKARYVARGFSQRQGVDFFQTFSPTPKMTTLQVLQQVTAQRDYKLHSLDFSTAFLQGSLHKEIWLRRPPGFSGSYLAGTLWSLRRPVYGLRQAPREWHDTLRTTLAALQFAPSTADPSLFLRTDTSLQPFYILVYIDDLVFTTADTDALALVKSELQKRHTCTDMGELRRRVLEDVCAKSTLKIQAQQLHRRGVCREPRSEPEG
ncbi:unnamed protein product, partial [Closterium sp. NIES-53]